MINKIFLSLLFGALLALAADGAITRGQTFNATNGATNTATLAVTVTAPNLADGKYHYMAVAVVSNGFSWPANDPGYSFSSYPMNVTNGVTTAIHIGRVFSGAGTTITFNTVGTTPIVVIGAEYTSDAPLQLDRSAVNSGAATPSASGTTSTTSNANELALAAHGVRTTNASVAGNFSAPTSSFTEILAGGKSSNVNTANNDREVDLCERILTATGTYSNQVTYSTGNTFSGVIVTLEEVAVASGSSTRPIPSIGH